MDMYKVRCLDGGKADGQESISVEAEDAVSAAEFVRGFKLTSEDMLGYPCAEVWPDSDPLKKTSLYLIR